MSRRRCSPFSQAAIPRLASSQPSPWQLTSRPHGDSDPPSAEVPTGIPRFRFLPSVVLVFIGSGVPIRQPDLLSSTSFDLLSQPQSERSEGQERAVGISRLPWCGEGHVRGPAM